ncbi:alanine racemase C-terminal domain-containing protein, partial [Streptomyces niveus]
GLVVGSLVLSGPIARQVGELVGLGDTAIADWAEAADTIAYEIVTRIGPRVPRVYVNGQEDSEDAGRRGAGR